MITGIFRDDELFVSMGELDAEPMSPLQVVPGLGALFDEELLVQVGRSGTVPAGWCFVGGHLSA